MKALMILNDAPYGSASPTASFPKERAGAALTSSPPGRWKRTES